jgi:1-acyl-sn-glycerol-3-phosphate acyltransferase
MSGSASLLQIVSGSMLAVLARAVTGVRPIWAGSAPNGGQRIYFANHASHGDFILVATCLTPSERSRTAAVAGADYWSAGHMRRFISRRLLRTVLVERNWVERTADPMQVMLDALDAGESLIFFPEGTRNMTEEPLLRFRSGLYNLAVARPGVELVPCWIENMSRVLPKGALLPVPLLCRTVFGAPVTLKEGEDRKEFLERARQALLSLAPRKDGNNG